MLLGIVIAYYFEGCLVEDSIFEHGVVAMDCYFCGILIPKIAAIEAFGKIGDQ